jgi:hypothetical protein
MQEILKGKKKGVAFVCQYAEEGTCGPWRYIYCDQGETQGTRLGFFDEQGRLAAAYWTSDYGEFCGGRASNLTSREASPRAKRAEAVLRAASQSAARSD